MITVGLCLLAGLFVVLVLVTAAVVGLSLIAWDRVRTGRHW